MGVMNGSAGIVEEQSTCWRSYPMSQRGRKLTMKNIVWQQKCLSPLVGWSGKIQIWPGGLTAEY